MAGPKRNQFMYDAGLLQDPRSMSDIWHNLRVQGSLLLPGLVDRPPHPDTFLREIQPQGQRQIPYYVDSRNRDWEAGDNHYRLPTGETVQWPPQPQPQVDPQLLNLLLGGQGMPRLPMRPQLNPLLGGM